MHKKNTSIVVILSFALILGLTGLGVYLYFSLKKPEADKKQISQPDDKKEKTPAVPISKKPIEKTPVGPPSPITPTKKPDAKDEEPKPEKREEPSGPEKIEEPSGPKREEPIEPERIEEPIRPERIEEPIGPERIEEPIGPERIEEPIGPERIEKPIGPERIEEPIEPEREEPIEPFIQHTWINTDANYNKLDNFVNMEEPSKDPEMIIEKEGYLPMFVPKDIGVCIGGLPNCPKLTMPPAIKISDLPVPKNEKKLFDRVKELPNGGLLLMRWDDVLADIQACIDQKSARMPGKFELLSFNVELLNLFLYYKRGTAYDKKISFFARNAVDPHWWEDEHRFIQTIFPSPRISNITPERTILPTTARIMLHENRALVHYTFNCLMLQFIEFLKTVKKRSKYYETDDNKDHNKQRTTRALATFKTFGFPDMQQHFFDFVKNYMHNGNITPVFQRYHIDEVATYKLYEQQQE